MILGLKTADRLDVVVPASKRKTKKQLYSERRRQRVKARMAWLIPNTPQFERQVQREIKRRSKHGTVHKDWIRKEALWVAYSYALSDSDEEIRRLRWAGDDPCLYSYVLSDSDQEIPLYYELVEENAELIDVEEFERLREEIQEQNESCDPNDIFD